MRVIIEFLGETIRIPEDFVKQIGKEILKKLLKLAAHDKSVLRVLKYVPELEDVPGAIELYKNIAKVSSPRFRAGFIFEADRAYYYKKLGLLERIYPLGPKSLGDLLILKDGEYIIECKVINWQYYVKNPERLKELEYIVNRLIKQLKELEEEYHISLGRVIVEFKYKPPEWVIEKIKQQVGEVEISWVYSR